jgi:hypothetical protein
MVVLAINGDNLISGSHRLDLICRLAKRGMAMDSGCAENMSLIK